MNIKDDFIGIIVHTHKNFRPTPLLHSSSCRGLATFAQPLMRLTSAGANDFYCLLLVCTFIGSLALDKRGSNYFCDPFFWLLLEGTTGQF
jgi:hypothetical protein